MSDSSLVTFSNQLADHVAAAAGSVVQVQGRRRPASGLIHSPGVVVTTARAAGGEEGIRVRGSDGQTADAEVAGWDPATHLVVLRTPDLGAPALVVAEDRARVGHLVVAVARSWSNVVTASAGIVAVIGGPLATGRGRSIAEVMRTTAPMHEGFAGGAVLDAAGRLLGIATAASIRGLGVVIPAAIAWSSAAQVLEHGTMKRGYLGLAGQSVTLSARQRGDAESDQALLVAAVSPGSPADAAGLLVGDVITTFSGQAIHSPEDLLEALAGDRVGQAVAVGVLRGGERRDVTVTVGERARK